MIGTCPLHLFLSASCCFIPGFQSSVYRSFHSLRNINKRSWVSLVGQIDKRVYCRVVESTHSLTPIPQRPPLLSLCFTRYLLTAFFEYYSQCFELKTNRTLGILNGFAVTRLHDERLFYGLEKKCPFFLPVRVWKKCAFNQPILVLEYPFHPSAYSWIIRKRIL